MATFFHPVTEFDYHEGEIQDGQTSLVKVKFVSQDGAGGYLPCATSAFNPRTERREVFHIHKAAGDTFSVPPVGKVVNGWHLGTVRVEYSPDEWPTVTIEAHRHKGDIPQGLTFSASIVFPAGWGLVPAWCGDGGRGATYTLQGKHAQLSDEEGEVVHCSTYGGEETVVGETTCGEPSPPDDGWAATGAGGEENIGDIHYVSAEFVHALQADPVSTP